jgi:transcriptional regulator with PAS, ATPase and Fis domain
MSTQLKDLEFRIELLEKKLKVSEEKKEDIYQKMEKKFRVNFIKRNNFNKSKLSELLGVSRMTIYRDLEEINEPIENFKKMDYDSHIAFVRLHLDKKTKKTEISKALNISRTTLYRYISDIKKSGE